MGKEYSITHSELRFFGQIGESEREREREDNTAAITATIQNSLRFQFLQEICKIKYFVCQHAQALQVISSLLEAAKDSPFL